MHDENYCLCDLIGSRDIKIPSISRNWFFLTRSLVFLIQYVTFLVSGISQKTVFNCCYQGTNLFTSLTNKTIKNYFFIRKFNLIKNFYSNKLIYLLVFLKIRNNFVDFVTPVVEKWLIHMKSSVAAPAVLILLRVLSYD